jgi:thiamine transporter ThiT
MEKMKKRTRVMLAIEISIYVALAVVIAFLIID